LLAALLEAPIFIGITLGEYYRRAGYDVLLIAGVSERAGVIDQ
jgi:vacuolar-type H+-ATPase catalytic subunit A/Vma1